MATGLDILLSHKSNRAVVNPRCSSCTQHSVIICPKS